MLREPSLGGGRFWRCRRELPIWSLRASSLRARFGTVAPPKGHSETQGLHDTGASLPRPIRGVPPSSGKASGGTHSLSRHLHHGLWYTFGHAGGPRKRIPSLETRNVLEITSQHAPYFRDGKTKIWKECVLAQDHKKTLGAPPSVPSSPLSTGDVFGGAMGRGGAEGTTSSSVSISARTRV